MITLSHEQQYSRKGKRSVHAALNRILNISFSEGSIHEISNQKHLLQSWINSNHIYGLIWVVLSDEGTSLVACMVHLHAFCPLSNTPLYHTGDFPSLAFYEQVIATHCVTIPKPRVDLYNKGSVWFLYLWSETCVKQKKNNQICSLQVLPHRLSSKWHSTSCSI